MIATNAALLLILLSTGQAKPATKPEEPQLGPKELARWTAFYLREAEDYTIYYDEEREIKLEFQPQPVFRFAEPKSGNEFNGVFFVWTYEGRPEVIGSIWSIHYQIAAGKRAISHSFHSLALRPLHANRKGADWWSPSRPGIDLKPIADAPLPADTARFRLVQMRALARDFTATTYLPEGEREMQMLPQPIYRFQSGMRSMKDGAIFMFRNDWDPEVLLVVESRETPDGPRWHYAPVRFCYNSALVKYKGQEVWKYDMGGPMTDLNHVYFSTHRASIVDWRVPPE